MYFFELSGGKTIKVPRSVTCFYLPPQVDQKCLERPAHVRGSSRKVGFATEITLLC